VADRDTTLVEQIFHFAQRQRKPNYSITAKRMISGLALKYRKGERFVIQPRQWPSLPCGNPSFYDNTSVRAIAEQSIRGDLVHGELR
jgi:hypothetical protein